MEELSHLKGLTWRVGAQSRYESSWMACHRFAYLNAISGQEFYKAMTDHAGKQRSISGNNFEAYIWKSKELLGSFSDHIKDRSIRNLFGNAADKLFSEVYVFRYCPECLKELFHSPIFYFLCVTHCPLHLVPLTGSCQTGQHIIGGSQILPHNFKNPLACKCCGIDFSQTPFSARAAGEGQAESPVLEAIEKWLQRLKNWRFDGVHFRMGDDDNSQTIVLEAMCETMVLLCEPPLNNGWLKFQCSTIHVAKSRYLENIESYWRGRDPTSLNEDIDSACKIIKSIGRHLRRRLRDHCGHKGNRCLNWTALGDQQFLLMNADCCPYCSALIQWRAYAGQLLGLRAWIRKCRRPLFDFDQIFRVGYSVDVNICAEVALSSFTWFAVALARNLEAIQNSDDKMLFANEAYHIVRSRNWEEYELPTYKHEFQFKGLRFKNSRGENDYFRFSLCFALSELGKCKNGIEPFDGGNRRNVDMWYISMSYNNVGRLGTRFWHYFFEPFCVVR